LKHAAPTHIQIRLTQENTQIILMILDDGQGIASTAWETHGMGLKTMQYRAALIGATLSIVAAAESGTSVTCILEEIRSHVKRFASSK